MKSIKNCEISDEKYQIQQFRNYYFNETFYIPRIQYTETLSFKFPYIFNKEVIEGRTIFIPIVFRELYDIQEFISKIDSLIIHVHTYPQRSVVQITTDFSLITLLKSLPFISPKSFTLDFSFSDKIDIIGQYTDHRDGCFSNNNPGFPNIVGYYLDENILLSYLETKQSLYLFDHYHYANKTQQNHLLNRENSGINIEDIKKYRQIIY